MKEGVIKFNYDWKKKPLPASLDIGELVKYRNKLRDCTGGIKETKRQMEHGFSLTKKIQ